MDLAMNDDPTQLFPETHWKRHATEAVSVPARDFGRVLPNPVTAGELTMPALPAKEAQKLTRLPTRPLLS